MPTNQILESSAALSQLPFHDLDNDKFLKATGAWVYRSVDKLSHKQD